MMNYQEIKAEKEKKVGQLIKDCGMFFAFSNKQWDENKTPLKEGEKYLDMRHGSYMPKSQIDNWKSGIATIEKWAKDEIKKGKLEDEEILSELYNYECFYTGSIEDAMDALGSKYPEEKVWAIYNKNKKEAFELNEA